MRYFGRFDGYFRQVLNVDKMNEVFTRFAGEGGDNALIDEGEFCEMVENEISTPPPLRPDEGGEDEPQEDGDDAAEMEVEEYNDGDQHAVTESR